MELKFDDKGLICAIAQDYKTGEVLMQAYMNQEAYEQTLATGYAHYFSRSRNKLWKKGEESGHLQRVLKVAVDCDNDCVLLTVEQLGAACHTNNRSCFYTNIKEFEQYPDFRIIFDVDKVIADRKVNPVEGSYTNYLFDKGLDKICKKVGEEASEVIIAAKNKEHKELVGELSDLLYHSLVLMKNEGVEAEEIFEELMRREGKASEEKYKKKPE